MKLVEVRLRDLPTAETQSEFGYEFVKFGGWTFDADEEGNPAEAWAAAKAWAAYAIWLQAR